MFYQNPPLIQMLKTIFVITDLTYFIFTFSSSSDDSESDSSSSDDDRKSKRRRKQKKLGGNKKRATSPGLYSGKML